MIKAYGKSHAVLAAIVCSLHVAVLVSIFGLQKPMAERTIHEANSLSKTEAYVIDGERRVDVVPLSEAKLAPLGYRATQLTQIRFEDTEQGDVSGVVAAASAPRLTETCAQVCDAAEFAVNLGLAPGQAVTVVLVIEVLPDGSTGSIEVSRSSGKSSIDSAASQFARTLKWIPGTREQKRIPMRIAFPVTLASLKVQGG